jgi:hypothetical protein
MLDHDAGATERGRSDDLCANEEAYTLERGTLLSGPIDRCNQYRDLKACVSSRTRVIQRILRHLGNACCR